VTWAANGVDLRDPLKPALPADSQAITLPSGSVRVTIVLLKEVLMCAWPTATFLRTRRRVRVLTGFLAMASSGSSLGRLLLAGDTHAPRALAAAGVGLGPLATDRKAAPVPQTAVGADLHQPLDVLRTLTPEVTFDIDVLD